MHSNVTIKNVSWPHFSWAILHVSINYAAVINTYIYSAAIVTESTSCAIPILQIKRDGELIKMTHGHPIDYYYFVSPENSLVADTKRSS